MKTPDPAAKAAALIERTENTMRALSEDPDMAKGAIGTVVLALMKSGEEVSTGSIMAELEAAAAGKPCRSDLREVLAKGALKVISDLPSRTARR